MCRTQFWIISIVLGVTSWAAAQNTLPAYVAQSVIGAKTGFTTNFTCGSHNLPLSLCQWERNPGTQTNNLIVTLNTANTRPGASSPVPGYSYIGGGLDKGECGLVISTVKEQDNGIWQCSLFADSGEFYRGTVSVGILRKPEPPRFNVETLGTIVENPADPESQPPSNITCYSTNGQPSPKFQWFLDDEPIIEGLSKVEESVANSNSKVYTFQYLLRRFVWGDNGKKLRCVVIHDALTDRDLKEVSLDVNVQFAPRASRDGENRVQVIADLGTEAMLTINVSASPKPNNIFWQIDGKQIREGETYERYHVYPIREIGNGIWECRLKISSVEEEDINKKFIMNAQNLHGEAQFTLTVASNSSGSGGLSAGGIVGLVIGIPAFLIIIAVIVVYTRARGMLCFKGDDGTSSEKERMDGDSNGGTTTDEKPSRRLSSRLSAFYENLLAKKKDKTAPLDEEANKEKDKEKEANESLPAVPIVISDDKKPEDIVYAELDLARGVADGGNPQVVVRCTDDKTEYAEIIGVVPHGLTVDETSPSKKSSGSNNSSPTK